MSKSSCKPFNQTFNIGDKLICPVCGKEFIATESTSFALTSGFTCSWACFLTKVNECEAKKRAEDENAKPWINIKIPVTKETIEKVKNHTSKAINKKKKDLKNVLFKEGII